MRAIAAALTPRSPTGWAWSRPGPRDRCRARGVQELFAAATRKLRIPAERARSHVEKWSKIDVVVIRPEIILGAIDLHRLHSLSFWDALVIKAASVAGCGRLLSADLNHGQAIDGVTIENPFR